MSVDIEEGPDERLVTTPSLCLRFRWTGDRWTHQLEARMKDGTTRLAASALEAGADRADPARVVSPTYQEVHVERDGEAVLIMALGRFDRHHFASTICVESSPDPVAGKLESRVSVDVADRCPHAIEAFAATYTVHSPPGSLGWATETGACWSLGADEVQAVLERHVEDVGTRMVVGEAGRAACRAQVLGPASDHVGTHRLRYQWIVSNHA